MNASRQPAVKSGDIVGFSGRDPLSDFINLVSLGIPRYSIAHVGIALVDGPHTYLYESLQDAGFRGPCVRKAKRIRGVQAHLLDKVVALAPHTAIWHYPLRRPLYPHEEQRLLGTMDSLIGTPYDVSGAARSAGIFLPWIEAQVHREDRTSYFCSEFCADMLMDVGLFVTPNIGMWCPNRLTRHLVRSGTCDRPTRLK